MKCKNQFTVGEDFIDMRKGAGELIKPICCKYCYKRLKKAMEKFEKKIKSQMENKT